MQLFLDSANLQELELCLKRGVLRGVTTNPSIISKEPKTAFIPHIRRMAELCEAYGQRLPLSAEVFTDNPADMLLQAREFVEQIGYKGLVVKMPIGWGELEAIYQLAKEGIPVNCTCLFTEAQCALAAGAGASYVSLFMGRLKDIGADPLPIIERTRSLIDRAGWSAQIIVGSIRHVRDIADAHNAGAHIVTAPLRFLEAMASHPQTAKSVQDFLRDFQGWIK